MSSFIMEVAIRQVLEDDLVPVARLSQFLHFPTTSIKRRVPFSGVAIRIICADGAG